MTIRNPMEWIVDEVAHVGHAVETASHVAHPADEDVNAGHPTIKRIRPADLWDALTKGFDDFKENRTDVVFLCFLYPVLGLLFARLASGSGMLQLVFPLAAGFALLGPVVGVGLYEMSRQRELGKSVSWADAFNVVQSPAFGSIIVLGLALLAVFLMWLVAANSIYMKFLGPELPSSASSSADPTPSMP